MTTWSEVLDGFEARIAEQRAALDRGEVVVFAPFIPPAGMGPLDGEDLVRARAVLDDCDDLVAEISGAQQHVREDLSVVQRLSAATAPPTRAHFIDAAL